MSDMNRYSVAAALLAQGRTIHLAAIGLSAAAGVALAVFVLNDEGGLAAIATWVVLLGLAETWFAIRTGFDAALFRRLSRMPPGDESLASLDAALTALTLVPEDKTGREPQARLSGAFRLMKMQGFLLIVQAGGLCALLGGLLWR